MDLLSTILPFPISPVTTPRVDRLIRFISRREGRAIRRSQRLIATILVSVTIALAGAPGGAADLVSGVVTPRVSILPLGGTLALTTTGRFTDGTTRRLSHATIAVGGHHACVLEPNGEIRCWGRGGSGQLGNGTSADSSVPVTVAGLVDTTDLAAGGDASCALLADTSIRCWGLNTSGQLGNGTTTPSALPVAVPGVTARAISVGFAHACAVSTNGEVVCWGANGAGQLGNGSSVGSSLPVLVSGITTAVGIAAGGNHSCALLATG
ncbi:hypothetical protein K2X89_03360, partial [Myxococcota bacterium]|nr:hypothetical protein [Myxococcota bacterium]